MTEPGRRVTLATLAQRPLPKSKQPLRLHDLNAEAAVNFANKAGEQSLTFRHPL